mgnify:CR=1 FL=1
MLDYLKEFLSKHRLTPDYLSQAEYWFDPLLTYLAKHKNTAENKPLFIGINGCQGSGKSTLADYLATRLIHGYGLRAVSLSLDDFYLSQEERKQVSDKVHPLFASRGVPGTHNTEQIKRVLMQLKNRQVGFQLPRFDKSTDNPYPKEEWPQIEQVPDIVIMEGWCWGVPAQSSKALQIPVNTLEANKDPDQTWRQHINQQLKQKYLPLYLLMDTWLMLKAPSFDCVYSWRQEQEEKLRAKLVKSDQTNVMSNSEIRNFILHFQRLTEHCLASLPETMDLVFELDNKRNIINCQQNSEIF